jgi:hypothetical protein
VDAGSARTVLDDFAAKGQEAGELCHREDLGGMRKVLGHSILDFRLAGHVIISNDSIQKVKRCP